MRSPVDVSELPITLGSWLAIEGFVRFVVAGAGYVGLATAIGFALEGHRVDVVDLDPRRANAVRNGQLPFLEASLRDTLVDVLSQGLAVHDSYKRRFPGTDFAFVCVDTNGDGGALHTGPVESAVLSLAEVCPKAAVIVIRSTVNPGTSEKVTSLLRAKGFEHEVLVNPEFLREGSALADFRQPPRIVIGGVDPKARQRLAAAYAFTRAPTIETDPNSAELIKLASNAALAVRVSLANEIAELAIDAGADVEMVLKGVGADPRIGEDYLKPGIGFGGNCLPKDLDALRSQPVPTPLFDGAAEANLRSTERLVESVLKALPAGSPVCVVGAGFKPGTDSIRGSRSILLMKRLLEEGYRVTSCDKLAEANVRDVLDSAVSYVSTPQEAAECCDGVILAHPLADEEISRLGPAKYVWDDIGRVLQAPTKGG